MENKKNTDPFVRAIASTAAITIVGVAFATFGALSEELFAESVFNDAPNPRRGAFNGVVAAIAVVGLLEMLRRSTKKS